jgi:hypothetical protein
MMAMKIKEVEATRACRFLDLRDHYEADGPDCTVPGASTTGRWAVLTVSTRGRFLNRAATREDAEHVAGANIDEGWEPRALFDLDELTGEPPRMVQAEYGGWIWDVMREQVEDGQETGMIELRKSPPDERSRFYDRETVHRDQLTNIEWSDEDTRLPVRYEVAGVRRVVAFNTVPGGADPA